MEWCGEYTVAAQTELCEFLLFLADQTNALHISNRQIRRCIFGFCRFLTPQILYLFSIHSLPVVNGPPLFGQAFERGPWKKFNNSNKQAAVLLPSGRLLGVDTSIIPGKTTWTVTFITLLLLSQEVIILSLAREPISLLSSGDCHTVHVGRVTYINKSATLEVAGKKLQ